MATRKAQPTPPPATEDAWRALSLQLDLVKHAETKAAATLASSGVLGGLLYTLVAQHPAGGVLFTVFAAITAAAIVVAGTAAGIALRPRLFLRRSGQNLLFYSAIARRFGHDADRYGRELSALITDRSALLATLAGQIVTNAIVATRKYRAVSVAVFGLLAALGLLAITAVIGLSGR